MALCRVCREALQDFHDPARRIYSFWYWLLWLGGKYDDIRTERTFLQRLLSLLRASTPSHLVGHHRSFESYLQSRREGCIACTNLPDASEDDVNPAIGKKGYFSLCTIEWPRVGFKEPRFLIYYGTEMDGSPFTLWKGDSWLNVDISPSTEDKKAWTKVQQWLDSCLDSHQTCDVRVDKGFMPSRVLEVSETPGEGLMFRLVTRDQTVPGARYVTLSYCWGGPPSDESFILTKPNLKSLSSWQSVALLPRTFRDAFEITRRLGMCYLWIDRFCILQDSVEDWKVEAASMRDVYGNTFFTVAALSAGNDDGGCFFGRDPLDVGPGVVSLRQRASDKQSKWYILQLEYTDAWRNSLYHEALLHRGWVLQERLLSPRVAYFGRKQIFWECREANRCETHPTTVFVTMMTDQNGDAVIDNEHIHGERSRWKQLSDMQLAQLPDQDPVQQALAQWRVIVGYYGGCHLTVASDRFVALSAVAADMQLLLRERELDARYLAGIWAYEMPFGLLWNTMGEPSAARPAASAYRAPSWSWASIDISATAADASGLSPAATFVSAAIDLMDEGNEVGMITAGCVRVKGKLFRAHLEGFIPDETNERWRYITRLNQPDGSNREIIKLEEEFRWNYAHFDTIKDIHAEFLVFPIGIERRENPVERCWVIKSLALKPEGSEDGRFRRLGYVELTMSRREELETILGAVEERHIELA